MKRYFILGVIISFLYPAIADAQDNTHRIEGVVCSTDGEPIIGAVVKEYKNGPSTSTDLDGKYSLDLSGVNSAVEFSAIGFKQKYLWASSDLSNVKLLKYYKDRNFYFNVGAGFESMKCNGEKSSSELIEIVVGRHFYIRQIPGEKTLKWGILLDYISTNALHTFGEDKSSGCSVGPTLYYSPKRLVHMRSYAKITAMVSDMYSAGNYLDGFKGRISVGGDIAYGFFGFGLECSYGIGKYKYSRRNSYVTDDVFGLTDKMSSSASIKAFISIKL